MCGNSCPQGTRGLETARSDAIPEWWTLKIQLPKSEIINTTKSQPPAVVIYSLLSNYIIGYRFEIQSMHAGFYVHSHDFLLFKLSKQWRGRNSSDIP